MKLLKPFVVTPNTINLQDEKPTNYFGPHIEDREDSPPPFYVTLNVHDKFLHICLLDFVASHNLMPKVVIDKLGFEIQKYIMMFILLIPRESNAWVL